MSRPRASSDIKTAHSVSLKVLRLSAPQLSHQCPLLPQVLSDANNTSVDARAGLAFPASQAESHDFILAPVLTLPPAFGATHVGETFACTICVNDETLGPGHDKSKLSVSSIKVSAEMQTPSHSTGVALDLDVASAESDSLAVVHDKSQRHSMQRIVRWDLRDEGTHVLAVTVTYTETYESNDGSGGALGGNVRTFRKLYQFIARPLLSVRTKARPVLVAGAQDASITVLEAQLENVSEVSINVEKVHIIEAAEKLTITSLNEWEEKAEEEQRLRLNPRDVLQVAFLMQQELVPQSVQSEPTERIKDLGRLAVVWKGAMGEKGSLATGNLTLRE